MDLEHVKRQAERIRGWLEASGNHADAAHLGAYISVLDDPGHRGAALSGLGRMCEAEWLGSAYQSATDRTVWLRELDALRRGCEAVRRRDAREGRDAGPPRDDFLGGVARRAAALQCAHAAGPHGGARGEALPALLGAILALLLLGSVVLAGSRLPTPFAPALVEVDGAVEGVRTETTLIGGFRGTFFPSSRLHVELGGAPVLYEVEVGLWQSAADLARTLREAGRLTLLVDEARLGDLRARIEAIRRSAVKPEEAGSLAVRALVETWYAPVPVYEVRAGGEVLATRLEMTRRDVADFVLWSGVALAALASLVVLVRRERRRSSFGRSRSRTA